LRAAFEIAQAATAARRQHARMEAPDDYVARMVYASESTVHDSVYAQLERIRASALRYNVPLHIHTALLYQSGWFVQWMEGPGEALMRLLDRIQSDPRHRNMRVVHSSRGPRLLCGPWSMAIVNANEVRAAMQDRVARAYQAALRGRQYGLPAIWRHLSTPHVGPAQPGEADRYQRILVCASGTREAFELVDWLGREHTRPVVHRRFAGEEGLDIGTDYVDFAEDGRAFRVIAMANNGLQLPLTRAFIPDYSRIVLLFGGDPQRDLQLVHRLGEACANLVTPPPVAGVAVEPAVHTALMAVAAQGRLEYSPVLANPESAWGVWQALRYLLRSAGT
jgi:hypothetical protein